MALTPASGDPNYKSEKERIKKGISSKDFGAMNAEVIFRERQKVMVDVIPKLDPEKDFENGKPSVKALEQATKLKEISMSEINDAMATVAKTN